ncbi:hypothetical protein ABZ442_17450 [Streptomyces triculaminicus]|uniref:hypothetical protein n=1 Tax=Streptomyces triculaminicus TaxID=2816232 RepID=UPI0033FF0DD7
MASTTRSAATASPDAVWRAPGSGHGGDELLLATPSHLRTMVRERPWAAVGALHARRAPSRWSAARMLRAL